MQLTGFGTRARLFIAGAVVALAAFASTGAAEAGCRVEVRNNGRTLLWANFNFSGTRFFPSGYRPADNAPTVKRLIRSYRFAGFGGAAEGCRALAQASLRDLRRAENADQARYELTGCYVRATGKARERYRAEARRYCGKQRTVR